VVFLRRGFCALTGAANLPALLAAESASGPFFLGESGGCLTAHPPIRSGEVRFGVRASGLALQGTFVGQCP
jgi:hypothetical protein